MRRLTERDIENIVGTMIKGYCIEAARIKKGPYSDSGHYGFILGRNTRGHYVTWHFHLLPSLEQSGIYGRKSCLNLVSFAASGTLENPQNFRISRL